MTQPINLGTLAPALTKGLADLDLSSTDTQQSQLLAYLGLIAQWNKVYNLTAIREPADMLTHHLLDSLAIIPALLRHTKGQATTLLDVGAGAGLPGVVIAIMCPEIAVTCIDTVAKKAAFMTQVAGTLRLPNFRAVHGRVEAWPSKGFDIITSRAFASLQDFVNWTLFHVKPIEDGSSVWMALKGKLPHEELSSLPAQVQLIRVEPLNVPGLDAERCLIWLRPTLG